VEVAELKAEEIISGHANSVPKVQPHFNPAKPFSFVYALKNSVPNPSPPLTRGRRSKKDQIVHGAEKNKLIIARKVRHLRRAPYGPRWQIRGDRGNFR
jgi:hypothetical protein